MKKLKIVIIILIAGYLIASFLLYIFQDKMIFQGMELDAGHEYSFDRPFTEVNMRMEDGGTINALFFENEEPKGLILYYHGNAGNLAGWGFVAEDFIDLGYSVAIMDYRGYGKSQGKRSQKTILSDAIEFYDHFLKEYSHSNIVLYGRSLGTGIAAYVASERPVDKLILETPYYNFTSLVQSHVPVFPAGPALKYKFPTNKYVKNVDCPVYIFHGTEDMIVPFKQGKRLFESMDENQATMYIIEGGEHNNLANFKEYWVNLERVLK